jgi:amidase
MTDTAYGAFVPGPAVQAAGAVTGPLAGLSFAAKDLFDVAGLVTGCGNPDWARTHGPAEHHAWAVQRLLDAGATLRGRTITDEISLGLLGRNQFQGTPVNPRAPARLPGGSSSGSAAAVAGGLVTVALGTDSGGSVRVPSSFTGLYGIRPTHGLIPVDGMMTQSPSFDTVGFFTRTADVFQTVGEVLFGKDTVPATPVRLLVATDAFATADAAVSEALRPIMPSLRSIFPHCADITLAAEGLTVWREHQRRLQMIEFAATFRNWIDETNPRFSFEVGRSLALAALLTEADVAADRIFRGEVRSRIDGLLDGPSVLCLPTVPILPPLRDISLAAMAEAGGRIVTLTCIAGLTGLPQINLPLAETPDGIPVGLSLIGWRGGDRALLSLAATLSAITPRVPA